MPSSHSQEALPEFLICTALAVRRALVGGLCVDVGLVLVLGSEQWGHEQEGVGCWRTPCPAAALRPHCRMHERIRHRRPAAARRFPPQPLQVCSPSATAVQFPDSETALLMSTVPRPPASAPYVPLQVPPEQIHLDMCLPKGSLE